MNPKLILSTVLAAAVLTGCSGISDTSASSPVTPDAPAASNSSSVRDEVGAWYTDNGSIFTDITDAMTSVSVAADDGDVDGLASACLDLGDVVDSAEALPPIPAPDVEDAWSTALDEFGSAADDCYSGVTEGDVDTLESSVEHLTAGAESIAEATDALDGYTG